MNVLLFGATGMVGKGALLEVSINGDPTRILDSPDINEAGRQTARTR